MQLGEILREARISRGWNQHSAASELQVSQPYVSMLENNKFVPGREVLHRLARVYQLDANLLLKLATEMEQLRRLVACAVALTPLVLVGLGGGP